MVKMLERLQSALKTVKDSRPSSVLSHRFVTVRRGSPASRSGQIQPGDQLEAVEGRPVVALQHRDLAQILRRAGNTLRLTVIPRHHAHSSVSEGAELDDSRLKGSRGRSKGESRFYTVDLERGPTGFGFSLRGGSEYNMGLYVLGLMEGGPAQRSHMIQVSDQLVEINGDSTGGMTHSQAVEQIRRGGHRIHLVLKKGNGYVPDYDPEEGALPPSSSPHTAEQGVDPVPMTTASLSWQRGGGGRGGERRRGGGRQKNGGGSTVGGETKRERGGGRGGRGTPDLDLDLVEEEAQEEERSKQEKKERRRQEEEERKRQEEERRGRQAWRSQTTRQKENRDDQRDQGRKTKSLPRNAAPNWDRRPQEEGAEDRGREEEEVSGGGRERRRRRGREREERQAQEWEEREEESGGQREGRRDEIDEEAERETGHAMHSGTTTSASNQKALFSFLMPLDDTNNHHISDNESVGSFSEVSLSAASIVPGEAGSEWMADSDWRRAESPWQYGNAPGPWLKPSPQRMTQALTGSRLMGRDLAGGLSLIG